MDSTITASLVLVAETEALVHKRQAEYQVQLQKHAKLQKQHEEQHAQLERSAVEVTGLESRVASLAHRKVQLQLRCKELLAAIEEERGAASRQRSRCCGVAAVEAGLAGTIIQEEAAMQRHAADMAEYVATHEAAVQRARDHLQQLQDKHAAVLAKRQREGLGDANRQLSQQLSTLQGEQAQLAAALEDAAAANVVAAARLAAAEHNLQHSVRQTKARGGELRSQMFQSTRQQAVNNMRLQHLQAEAARLQQHSEQLDVAIHGAQASVDRLAGR